MLKHFFFFYILQVYREIKQEYKDHNYKNKTLIFLLEIDMDVS